MQASSSKPAFDTQPIGVPLKDWDQLINEYNDEIEHILLVYLWLLDYPIISQCGFAFRRGSKVKVWRSASLLSTEKADSPDGVQMGKIALDYVSNAAECSVLDGYKTFLSECSDTAKLLLQWPHELSGRDMLQEIRAPPCCADVCVCRLYYKVSANYSRCFWLTKIFLC